MGKSKIVTDEQRLKVISLYNNSYSISEIARRLEWDRKFTTRYIDGLISIKDLKQRSTNPMRTQLKTEKVHTSKTIEKMEVIQKLWNQGIKQKDIATHIGMSLRNTNRLIGKMKAEGLLPERHIKREKEEAPKAMVEVKAKRVAPPTLAKGETINCTPAVARTCVYGGRSLDNGLCRYSAVTDKCRSVGAGACKFSACDKYSKISKDNPRLKSE